MALSYDPGSKKWNVSYEKTDNKTDYSTDNKTTKTVYVSTTWINSGKGSYKQATVSNTPIAPSKGVWVGEMNIDRDTTAESISKDLGIAQSLWSQLRNKDILPGIKQKIVEQDTAVNNSYRDLNTTNATTNKSNKVKNDAYDKTVTLANNTKGGDYVSQRNTIRNVQGLDEQTKKTLENYYKAFYSTEKLQQWDPSLGAKPPYGEFDSSYYKTQNPAAAQQWTSAVANDDIDITQRYGEGGFYLQHYTTQGKPAGLRGNKAEITEVANQYLEKTPTDVDLQAARTRQLGVDTDVKTDRLLNIPTVSSEWEKAKSGDSYWKEQAAKKFLDINNPDEFAALFRLSDRPEDQIVRLNNNANVEYGITELEDLLGEAVAEKTTVDIKRFGALTQDVLKQTIDEMKKAKVREQEISMFKGFGDLGEIMNINKELSNSIMGDSGVGGVLSFMGGDKAQESLDKSLAKVTGVNTNNTIYNWQKWFDETLKTKYEDNLELGYTSEQAKEQVKVEADFAKEFVDKYLVPRFNESRSMDEFVEYLDVGRTEQNPLQTQDTLNAARLVADVRARSYLDQLKATPGRYFDSNFYFNPTGDKAREGAYADQASTVAADWETAKKGDEYWKSQAYRFGVDIKDKDAFARMHFQVKGQGKGYDPADDILNASKVSDYIYTQILPAIKEEALDSSAVFNQFITPDEFADEMLRGLDPNDKGTWDEVLRRYGMPNFKGNIDELKDYVKETLRAGSAQEMRDSIQYLNDKREKPTQQNLGVTYIERPEDYTDEQAKPQTELYRTFQSAGFQGTEDAFYKDFFPDMDRSEQIFLTKSGKDESLKTFGLDFSNASSSLGTVESFFDVEKPEETIDKPEPKTNSYFRIAMGEDEDEPTTKSKSGASILGEFTSMFKGL